MNVVMRTYAIKAMPSLRIRLALAVEDLRESRRDGLPLSRLLTLRYLLLVALGR
jgi:hypothetical protein